MSERQLFAADILKADHPLNKAFRAWLEKRNYYGKHTKRKAREFLQQFPQYREVKEAT